MISGREIDIAVLEESQKDLGIELRDIDFSLKEILHGVRPKAEKTALAARRRRVEMTLERTKAKLHELTGA